LFCLFPVHGSVRLWKRMLQNTLVLPVKHLLTYRTYVVLPSTSRRVEGYCTGRSSLSHTGHYH
jgi:hypothetical protein